MFRVRWLWKICIWLQILPNWRFSWIIHICYYYFLMIRISPKNFVKMSGFRGPVSCRRRRGVKSQKTAQPRVYCVCTIGPRRSVFLWPKPIGGGRRGVQHDWCHVYIVYEQRARGRLPAYRKIITPKKKIQSGQRHYTIVYEENKKKKYIYSPEISILNMYGTYCIILHIYNRKKTLKKRACKK